MGKLEVWKPINQKYSVSSYGRIRNDRTGKILTPRLNSCGYLRVNINGSEKFVHQLVAKAFLGRKSIGFVVNHKDGDKQNNCYWNLEYCTQSDNMLHYYRFLKQVKCGC